MDVFLKKTIDKFTPKENKKMMEGMAFHHSDKIIQYISNILNSFGSSLPKELVYVGYEFVSPEEEYLHITKPRNNKVTYETSKSDLRMIKINLEFNGEPLAPILMYIPYISRGGLLHMGGTLYNVTPIITDYVISLTDRKIFIRLLKDKPTFERQYHNIVINGKVKIMNIVYSNIYYNRSSKIETSNKTTKANATIVHYLLCKYGYTDMFNKHVGFVPIIGYDEINPKNYPEDGFNIYESTKHPPPMFKNRKYAPTRLKIVIPKAKCTKLTETLIAGLFYVFDNFTDYVDEHMLDNKRIWMVLLGHIYFTGNYSTEKLYTSIVAHVESLENYLDEIIAERLHEVGYKVNYFYDLLILVLENLESWIANYKEINESVHYRYMDVLYYILYSITTGIFKTGILLTRAAQKGTLTTRTITEIINFNLSTKRIFRLVKVSKPNLSLLVVNYSGDTLYPKMTAMLNLQEMGEGVSKAKRRDIPSRVKTIHGTEILVGSLFYVPKKVPTPLVRMNPYCCVDATNGKIIPNAKMRNITDRLTALLEDKVDELALDDLESIEIDEEDIED